MDKAVSDLASNGAVAWAEQDYYGHPQQRLKALREPTLSGFTGEEISIFDQVIKKLWELNASQVSVLSHHFIGWNLAFEGETIPYSTVALGEPRPPTASEIEYGRKLAASKLGG